MSFGTSEEIRADTPEADDPQLTAEHLDLRGLEAAGSNRCRWRILGGPVHVRVANAVLPGLRNGDLTADRLVEHA